MHSSKALWEKCLLKIKAVIPPESYSTWFSPIYPHSITEDRLIITVPNEFYKACLQENYHDIIKSILDSLTNESIKLNFMVEISSASNKKEKLPVLEEALPDQKTEVSIHLSSAINFKYNFSNFVVGSSNQFAHAAALAVANNQKSGATFTIQWDIQKIQRN